MHWALRLASYIHCIHLVLDSSGQARRPLRMRLWRWRIAVGLCCGCMMQIEITRTKFVGELLECSCGHHSQAIVLLLTFLLTCTEHRLERTNGVGVVGIGCGLQARLACRIGFQKCNELDHEVQRQKEDEATAETTFARNLGTF